jgi:ubiquinone/menaquinone biosynthesis C-methylase UbiE
MALRKDPEGTEITFLNRSVDFCGKRILEIGSGDGRLTWRFANPACRVIGIDPDMGSLCEAVTNQPANLQKTVSFVQASSINVPFPRETFDIAVLAWSF